MPAGATGFAHGAVKRYPLLYPPKGIVGNSLTGLSTSFQGFRLQYPKRRVQSRYSCWVSRSLTCGKSWAAASVPEERSSSILSEPGSGGTGGRRSAVRSAAAASNALVWTGWNQAMAQASGTDVMDEWEIYDYFINNSEAGVNDGGWFSLPAIRWILEQFHVDIDYRKVAQNRSPHDLFLSRPFLSSTERRCALYEIYTFEPDPWAPSKIKKTGHALTVYETSSAIPMTHETNDPRSVKTFSFCDSDDETELTRRNFQEHKITFDRYDVSKRFWFLAKICG